MTLRSPSGPSTARHNVSPSYPPKVFTCLVAGHLYPGKLRSFLDDLPTDEKADEIRFISCIPVTSNLRLTRMRSERPCQKKIFPTLETRSRFRDPPWVGLG